jgi:hypothetical protein
MISTYHQLLKESDSEELVGGVTELGLLLAEHKFADECGSIEDEWQKATTAILMENQERMFMEHPGYQVSRAIAELQEKANLNEATTTQNISTIDRLAGPIIRATSPNFIVNELASTQPLLGPTSMVAYMKATYSNSKGAAVAGQDPTMNPDEWYGSQHVDGELVIAGDGSTVAVNVNVAWTPVREATMTLSYTVGAVAYTARDDGAGALAGTEITTASINYNTGNLIITFATAPDNATNVTVTYDFNSEANDTRPEMDLDLITSPVTAEDHSIRVRWSVQSAQQLISLYGSSAEVEFGTYVSNELKSQIDRRVLGEIDRIASATATTFDRTPDSGVAYADHKLEFLDVLTEGSYNIMNATKSVEGNWIVMGTSVANIVDTLPGFVGNGGMRGKGARETGTLQGKWRCFVDPYRSNQASYTIGHKSGNLMEAGLLFCPYVLMYMTPTTTLDDFLSRKGFMTQFAVKTIDGNYYSLGTVTAS